MDSIIELNAGDPALPNSPEARPPLDAPELGEALTQEQEFLLRKCENIIRIGLGTFVEVGLALKEIQDQRLYRRTDKTFEDYLQRAVGLSRPYAYNLIESAKLMRELRQSSGLDRSLLPKNEAQARELIRIEPAQRVEVWKQVVDASAQQPLTAKLIRDVVRQSRRASDPSPSQTSAAPTPESATALSPEAGLALGKVKRLRELFANTRVAEDALQLIEKLEHLARAIGRT
jgi:hypothetical protein